MNLNLYKQCYEDILYFDYQGSVKHAHMSLYDRAAQFSPFAALNGHEAAILETARMTEEKIMLTEDRKAYINEKLHFLKEHIHMKPFVDITYFQKDERKEGGSYIRKNVRIIKIDHDSHILTFDDKTKLIFEDIIDIEFL